MNERFGKEITIRMKSEDAIFFDGGTVPHQITRVIPNTAPKWWDEEKVPNGSRAIVLFREKQGDFYKKMIKNSKKINKTSSKS